MKRSSAILACVFFGGTVTAEAPPPFDPATGNAAVEIVIPTAAPFIFQDISPTGGDATLVLRFTTLVTNAWFDATAPYHPTAVGVYSRLGRSGGPLPPAENTDLNTAILYASHEVLTSFLPARAAIWDGMLVSAGLDPADDTVAGGTAIAFGNAAGKAVVAGRENDGMNQLGFQPDREFNPTPYADYTGYVPVNTAFDLVDPSRWQPDIQRLGVGLYKIQRYVTPQYALVEPYAYATPEAFEVPPPEASLLDGRGRADRAPTLRGPRIAAYKAQADEVLEVSADLTEEQKLKAELFDNKINSLGFSAIFAAQSRGLSLLEFVQLDFLTNMAAFDAGIFIWQEKRRYDAVRPFSAIRYLYGDDPVLAWGGPGVGTTVLPADEWAAYLEEADHPEYPSASTCFCAAHTQSARLYLGGDELGFPVFVPAGGSRIEPGVTPASDTTIAFPTWSDFNADCGQSRLWAGVHFQAAIDASAEICNVFGDMAYDYVQDLIAGSAPARGPSSGRSVDTLPD